MKKIIAVALVLVLVLTASACAEISVCHHGDGKNCVAERNTVGKVAIEAPANLYDSIDAVKAAGFEALLSTSGLFNAVYNGSSSIVERYNLVLGENAVVPVKDDKLAVEDGAESVEDVKAPADFGTTFAVVRTEAGRFYGAVVICCCNGGNGGNGDHPVRTMGDHPAERPTDALASSNQGNEGPATVPATTTDSGNSISVETDAGIVIISFNTTPVASEGGEHGERPAAQ